MSESPPNKHTTIPTPLMSYEALRYLGFNEATAAKIWNRWENAYPHRDIDDSMITFFEMPEAHISSMRCSKNGEIDAYSDDDNIWLALMNDCGIDAELQTAIMDPLFRKARLSASCKFWLLDTIEARYASLEAIQATSSGSRSITERFGLRGMTTPITSSSPEVLAPAPGHTVLWRGVFAYRTDPFSERKDQSIYLGRLMSKLFSEDFTSLIPGVYMTVNFEVAQLYARYAQKRDPNHLVVILRMEIPNTAIDGLDSTQKLSSFWPSAEWKDLVWNSKKGYILPQRLKKYRRATLVVGTICGKSRAMIAQLSSPEDITQSMILDDMQGSGGDAIQYAFLSDEGMDFIEAYGIPNCSVHMITQE